MRDPPIKAEPDEAVAEVEFEYVRAIGSNIPMFEEKIVGMKTIFPDDKRVPPPNKLVPEFPAIGPTLERIREVGLNTPTFEPPPGMRITLPVGSSTLPLYA